MRNAARIAALALLVTAAYVFQTRAQETKGTARPSDQEEQQHDAELREKMNRVVGRIDETKAGDADDHTANQLAENSRLSDALSNLAEEFRGDEDGDEDRQANSEYGRNGYNDD